MAPAASVVRPTVVPGTPLLTRRIIWVVGISLANAAAAWLVATRVVQGAAGVGWDALIPWATLATLILTLGGLWWATRRRPRLRTGLGLGFAIGVLVHPVMWYLTLLAFLVSGTGSSLGDTPLTLTDAPAAGLMYAAISLFLTGWLSCPISAAICGAGLALYARLDSSGVEGSPPG